jgi:peptidoglycan/xylan/chitin deacetylase (PgdA/CDA1 family)
MSVNLRALARRAIAHALYLSGLLWLLASVRLRNRAVVLMYHRVLPDDADHWSAAGIVVTATTFSRHMKFLRRHFKVLSLRQLRWHLDTRSPLPSRSCVVTFDDGWSDNFHHALPILRSEGLPAIFCVATGFVGTQECFWQERVSRRLQMAVQVAGADSGIAALLGKELDRRSPELLRNSIHEAVSEIKKRRYREIPAIESKLEAMLAESGMVVNDYGDDEFMDWPAVVELERDGRCNVGAHGRSHVPLTLLPDEDAVKELRHCRRDIEAHIGHITEVVAYPNGDCDDRIIRLARQAGFRVGFTTVRGVLDANDDPMTIRRINIHDAATKTSPELLCTMLGVFRPYEPRP